MRELPSHSVCKLYTAQPYLSRDSTYTTGWALLHQLSVPQTCSQADQVEAILRLSFCLSRCVKTAAKISYPTTPASRPPSSTRAQQILPPFQNMDVDWCLYSNCSSVVESVFVLSCKRGRQNKTNLGLEIESRNSSNVRGL